MLKPELSLQQASDSALRHVVGSNKLDEVVSIGREQIGVDVQLLAGISGQLRYRYQSR